MSLRPTLSGLAWLNVAVKLALVALLLLAVFGDLASFEGKGTTARALTYPLAALVVPFGWWLRGRRGRYPHDVDVLFVLPFLIDTVGNALDLYDTVGWWDDANHLVNWAILAAAFARLLTRVELGPRHRAAVLAGLTVGFGAVTAVLWELAEYVAFIRDSPELDTAYEDTLGDLGLGVTGSALTAAVAGVLSRRPAGARPRSQPVRRA